MSRKLQRFVAGGLLGNFLFLNHIYEQELFKQDIRDEIQKLNNISDFQPHELVKYRDADKALRLKRMAQSSGVTSLENLDMHYRYFNYQLLNALKESTYRLTLRPPYFMEYYRQSSISAD